MFYHTSVYGSPFETPCKIALDMNGEFAVANYPSSEFRSDLAEQYFSEVRSGIRQVGQTLFFPGQTPEVSEPSKALQWL